MIYYDSTGFVYNTDSYNNESDYKSIIPINLESRIKFDKDIITSNTTFINIKKTDYDTKFSSIDDKNKSKLDSYEIENFSKFANVDKKGLLEKLIHLETGIPQKFVNVDNWYKINGKWYYFKNKYTKKNINELLGEVISEYFGLDTIHYKLAKHYDKNNNFIEEGILSENFCNPNYAYITCNNFKNSLTTIGTIDVLDELRKLCASEESFKLLQNKNKALVVRDFGVGQRDRYAHNFLFKEDNNSLILAPLYDYEDSFDTECRWKYENSLLMFNIFDSYTINLVRNDEEFQRLFNLLIDLDINELIKEVENRHKIKLEDFRTDLYTYYIDSVKDLVKKQKLIK